MKKNSKGKAFSPNTTAKKMEYDGTVTAIAFVLALFIGKGVVPSEDTIQFLLPTVGAITVGIKMLIRGIGNLLAFYKGEK